jgi:ADP-ribose pyrophosphatase YjhB (NUDIX family)
MEPGTLLVQYDEPTLDEILILAHKYDVFFRQIFLVDKHPEKVFEKLLEKCKVIEAAGGLVFNEKKELLLIFRNGKWDLPKGKIEKNETPEEAGVREVEEECGIGKLKITATAAATYHTYFHNEKYVLKKTYWYKMSCADEKTLVPQREEGITEVKWMNEEEVKKAMANTYHSIRDIVSTSAVF